MTTEPKMTTTAIAPWFGSNRTNAAAVGELLGRCDWVGVPFVGGGCELRHIRTRAGVANDLHRHVINLARVIADKASCDALADRLSRTLYHGDELAAAQRSCRDRESTMEGGLFDGPARISDEADVDWAYEYFICCWMGRSARSGTSTEFTGAIPVRFTSTGGDSATRFRSAIDSLRAWHAALLPWNFTTIDGFDFIDRVQDHAGHALYIDAPWPEAGYEYAHRFTPELQRRLAEKLALFEIAKVVVRFGDHTLIRSLYPSDKWTWIERRGRDQANADIDEVLICNRAINTGERA